MSNVALTDLLTTGQVQNLLKVDRTTIYRMVEDGRLPGIRVGKQWRFQRAEIEQWLKTHNTRPELLRAEQAADNAAGTLSSVVSAQATSAQTTAVHSSPASLPEALPLACVQLIQDAFAEMLGVMMIVTDMNGRPITQPSNLCGLYSLLIRQAGIARVCSGSWQHLAASPSLAPRFFTNEVGLLCARGLIHLDHAMAGMVIMGGIAPEVWPPAAPVEHAAQLASAFQLAPGEVSAHVGEVHRLDKADQDKALRCIQRIADIFSHIARDRSAMCGKLQAIASLTTL